MKKVLIIVKQLNKWNAIQNFFAGHFYLLIHFSCVEKIKAKRYLLIQPEATVYNITALFVLIDRQRLCLGIIMFYAEFVLRLLILKSVAVIEKFPKIILSKQAL